MLNAKEVKKLEETIEEQLLEQMRFTIHEAVHSVLEKEVEAPRGKGERRVGERRHAERHAERQKLTPMAELREIRNGVARPAPGGKCDAVWSNLDRLHNKGQATREAILKVGERKGWNPNNTRIEFYRWRKFHNLNQ